jgi:hypothetical protein
MIISRGYANKLVRDGKATLSGSTRHDGKRYQIVNRHDIQRVDHYELKPGQFTKLSVVHTNGR